MKVCITCKKELSLKYFYRRYEEVDGYRNECKICFGEKARKRFSLYIKKLKKNKRKYSERVKRRREVYFKDRYHLESGELEKMLKRQHGECDICQKKINLKTCKVDHCHKKGHVRGLLCNACNLSLGIFKDNIEVLKRAIRYLRKHK